MITLNTHYAELKDSYLFYRIAQKVSAYLREHPDTHLYRMGIGDVSLPLCGAVIRALHEAVDDQADKARFHGYMPECGAPFLREAIASHYARRGVTLAPDEVFASSGASDELGDILDLFDCSSTALVIEPAYPAYVDANVLAGRRILHLSSGEENGFLPEPDERLCADLIYICSPNNPTGAVFGRDKLQRWVDYANRRGAVILFDAAYEAFIEDPALPHSIFELDGARTCAIEICSLSKTAGFTGTRLGYTVIPKALERGGLRPNDMWVRNRTTKTNGVSYILQKGGAAVFTPEGQRQVRENIQVYKANAKMLTDALDALGVWYCGGKNAPYIWMKCPEGMSSWAFFDRLLNEAQVVGTPGEGFGACGEGYFRFSTFGDPEDTKEAARRLSGAARREIGMRDYEKEFTDRVAFIRQLLAESGAAGIVYGNSGGKDSALVGILCKAACENTVGLLLPCTSKRNYAEDRADAETVAAQYRIETRTVDLTPVKAAALAALDGVTTPNAPALAIWPRGCGC